MALTGSLKQNLKKKFTEENNNSRKNDPRVIPYFNMKDGDKMKILLVPDGDGELMKEWQTHYVRGAGAINCAYHSSGDNCPACARYFEARDANDEAGKKRWTKKYHILAQAVVIDSPVEIPDTDDDNLVKLFYMPKSVLDTMKEAIKEDLIEDPTQHVLVLKKSPGNGGHSTYEHSYFIQKPYEPDEDIQEAVDNGMVQPFTFSTMQEENDLIPPETRASDVEKWIEKADQVIAKQDSAPSNNADNTDDDDDQGDDDASDDSVSSPEEEKESFKEKLARRRQQRQQSSDD